MKVTFDSNAWETVFAPGNVDFEPIRKALQLEKIRGFICSAGFRIESIMKKDRSSYFSQPYMEVLTNISPGFKPGFFEICISIGPDNNKYPGLSHAQKSKLESALASGIKLIHGQHWMGLPSPIEISDASFYVKKDAEADKECEKRQILVSSAIEKRGVGKALFDSIDGWTDRPRTAVEQKNLAKACAEWADGELVAAHIAHQHDILCTNDRGHSIGKSIFDTSNRNWLISTYDVRILDVYELNILISKIYK